MSNNSFSHVDLVAAVTGTCEDEWVHLSHYGYMDPGYYEHVDPMHGDDTTGVTQIESKCGTKKVKVENTEWGMVVVVQDQVTWSGSIEEAFDLVCLNNREHAAPRLEQATND